jgi:hypothetical protein
MALAHCILGKFLGVGCHYFPTPLDVPIFIARCLHVHDDVRDPSSERWNHGREMLSGNFAEMTTSTSIRDFLHAANPRHETNGFTPPPKEGVLRIFSPLKIRRLRPGLNPQTWILKASTLPPDHRSRLYIHETSTYYKFKMPKTMIHISNSK